jgi:lipopolysaccharide transport system ATP-binding protein
MTKIAIRVEKLSKRYRIGRKETSRETFGGAVADFVTKPIRNLRRLRSLTNFQNDEASDVLWAVKDLSFEVAEGDVMGIIGRNGAGKTTLLRLLSRIAEPTSGRALLNGRVASLLEVGTGFHPELTGRENIYLNGSVLGMKRREIDRKFDEIVDFSEVEKFIDTPIKRYSTGMNMRLAFAVAAHLEPEILLVDEVLAVGDAGFQRKCLAKMDQVGSEGRTVLFVSHNMPAVTNLCKTAILLDGGHIKANGATQDVVQQHLASFDTGSEIPLDDRQDRFDGTRLRFTRLTLADKDGNRVRALRSGECAQIHLGYRSPTGETFRNVVVRLSIDSPSGPPLCVLETSSVNEDIAKIEATGTIVCVIPKVPLRAGSYPFTVYARSGGNALDHVQHAGLIEVEDGDFYGSGRVPQSGVIHIDHHWNYFPGDVRIGSDSSNTG